MREELLVALWILYISTYASIVALLDHNTAFVGFHTEMQLNGGVSVQACTTMSFTADPEYMQLEIMTSPSSSPLCVALHGLTHHYIELWGFTLTSLGWSGTGPASCSSPVRWWCCCWSGSVAGTAGWRWCCCSLRLRRPASWWDRALQPLSSGQTAGRVMTDPGPNWTSALAAHGSLTGSLESTAEKFKR